MNEDWIEEMIKEHEGYGGEVYSDTEGVLTCGWGHALHVGSPVPLRASLGFFQQDIRIVMEDYEKLNLYLDDVRRGVVYDMLYNLGLTKLLKFKKFLKALREDDYEVASKEMLDSKWAIQVKGRAKKLAKMMQTGQHDG